MQKVDKGTDWRNVISGTKGRVDMKSKFVMGAVVVTCLALAACNTVRGAARDVNSAANAVDNAT